MTHKASRQQRGFTMVESLVALVVLSVGLLGIASLYVTSLRTGRTAMLRTQAVTLVGDMADRIRANGRAGDAYDSASYGGGPALQGCVAGVNCSAEELAEDDLASWITAVDGALPAPIATVTFTPAVGAGRPDRYTIDLQWQEAAEEFSYTSNIQLIPVTP